MPEFEYKAVGKDDYQEGIIQAESPAHAEKLLSDRDLKVVGLSRKQPLALGFLTSYIALLNNKLQEQISSSEKILFTGQLSSMIKAGLPLIDALSAFLDQEGKKGINHIVSEIILELQAGTKFSDALARFPKIFSPAYIAVIRAGENSGTLAESLNYLAVQLKRESELLGKIKSAMIYPIVVVTVMITVMSFISISVVPKIVTFAQSSGQKLPGYTLAMVNTVTFFTRYWYLFAALFIAAIIASLILLRNKSVTHFLGQVMLRLPYIGTLISRYNQARFARVLGGFYIYGVDIISSFDIVAASLNNPIYQDSCWHIKKRLAMGESLAGAIQKEKDLYPSIMVHLIKGAEKTGELGPTLDKLAVYYEEELENSLKNTIALMEPALIFFLGFGVLALAMIVVVPIYKVTSSLK